jgi:hypothetical protein
MEREVDDRENSGIAEGGWEINMSIFVLSAQPRDFRRVAVT